MKKVIERILELKGGRSASAFARALGMRQQTVDNYLSSRRKMSLEFVYSVCCRCHVSCDWLLGFTDERTGSAAPVTDEDAAKRIEELEAECSRLRGKIEGMEYALAALGEGGVRAKSHKRGVV